MHLHDCGRKSDLGRVAHRYMTVVPPSIFSYWLGLLFTLQIPLSNLLSEQR